MKENISYLNNVGTNYLIQKLTDKIDDIEKPVVNVTTDAKTLAEGFLNGKNIEDFTVVATGLINEGIEEMSLDDNEVTSDEGVHYLLSYRILQELNDSGDSGGPVSELSVDRDPEYHGIGIELIFDKYKYNLISFPVENTEDAYDLIVNKDDKAYDFYAECMPIEESSSLVDIRDEDAMLEIMKNYTITNFVDSDYQLISTSVKEKEAVYHIEFDVPGYCYKRTVDVSRNTSTNELSYEEKVDYYYPEYLKETPFYVKRNHDNNVIAVVQTSNSTYKPDVYYSFDDLHWKKGTWNSNYCSIYNYEINVKIVYIKIDRRSLEQNASKYISISSSNNFEVGGNIMSLYAGDDFATATSVGNYDFSQLFKSAYLIDVQRLYISSIQSIGEHAMDKMFYNCSNLKKGAKLFELNNNSPLTNIGTDAFKEMYTGCTSLTEAHLPHLTDDQQGNYESYFTDFVPITWEGTLYLYDSFILPETIESNCDYTIYEKCDAPGLWSDYARNNHRWSQLSIPNVIDLPVTIVDENNTNHLYYFTTLDIPR